MVEGTFDQISCHYQYNCSQSPSRVAVISICTSRGPTLPTEEYNYLMLSVVLYRIVVSFMFARYCRSSRTRYNQRWVFLYSETER